MAKETNRTINFEELLDKLKYKAKLLLLQHKVHQPLQLHCHHPCQDRN